MDPSAGHPSQTPAPPVHAPGSEGKARLAVVMGHFSDLAEQRQWRDLEPLFNPNLMFEEVHVLALGDDYSYHKTRFGSLTVHPLRSLIHGRLLKRLNDLYLVVAGVLRLRRLVIGRKIDVVAQTWSTPLKFGLAPVIVGLWTKRPSVITLCSDYSRAQRIEYIWPVRTITAMLWSFLFRNATRVRSKSQFIARFAVERGVSPDRIHVVPNKVAAAEFQTPPHRLEIQSFQREFGLVDEEDSGVVFLTCGRLIPVKNHQRMLEAFASARRRLPDLTLLVAGTGPLLEPLQDLTAELGIDRDVHFIGQLTHQMLHVAYHLSDVFLFPSLYEGQPRVVLEATLAGLPVICAGDGSVTELVRHDVDGIHVDPTSVPDIANAILSLARDRGLRHRLGQHEGFETDRFSFKTVGEQERILYESALQTFRVSEPD